MKFSTVMLSLVFVLLLSSCVRLTDENNNAIPIVYSANEIYLQGSESQTIISKANIPLKALVKGSIYEEGEMMSVFGTCLDGYDRPVIGSIALFSAWYPNGTVYLTNYTMTQIQEGYFVYRGAMQAVEGTYLTQLECVALSGDTALAFGEWQNPFWVKRIKLLNDTINYNDNVTWEAISDINYELNQTNINLDEYYQNLTTQITIVGGIANSSVDRNDSLIMDTLRELTGLVINGVNNTGQNATYELDWDTPVFWRPWGLISRVYDDYGNLLSYPDVSCDVYTSLSGVWSAMVPQGNHFKYEEFINCRNDYEFNVSCYWN